MIKVIIAALLAGSILYIYYQAINAPVLPSDTFESTSQVENSDYIGMTPTEAESKAQSEDAQFRVVEIDGEPQPTTRDYRKGRINATITDGIVTSYSVEGSESESQNPQPEAAAGAQSNPYFQTNELAGDMIDMRSSSGGTSSGAHNEIIGMSVAEAGVYADTKSIDFRTGTIDGEAQDVTSDFRPGRITAEIEKGVVTGYTVEQE